MQINYKLSKVYGEIDFSLDFQVNTIWGIWMFWAAFFNNGWQKYSRF